MSRDIRKTKVAEIFIEAWTDPDFRDRLMATPIPTLEQKGFSLTQGMKVEVLQNTREIYFMIIPAAPWVVPTHLTMFPYIEDEAPPVQKRLADFNADVWSDDELKARCMEDPRGLLESLGVKLPDGAEIKILENTAQRMYLALPEPPGIQGVPEADIGAFAESEVVGVSFSKLY